MASTKIGKFARHTPSWRIINVIPQNFSTAETPVARPHDPAVGEPEQSREGRKYGKCSGGSHSTEKNMYGATSQTLGVKVLLPDWNLMSKWLWLPGLQDGSSLHLEPKWLRIKLSVLFNYTIPAPSGHREPMKN